MVKFLAFGMLATAIAAVILLLFTLIVSRLFTRPAPIVISHLMIRVFTRLAHTLRESEIGKSPESSADHKQ
jgi:hypothetical protein